MKESTPSRWADHFSVLRETQTYKNLAYLLLAFPLGIAYFVISVAGFSVGVGLLIIWIGLFILMALFAGLWGIAAFERQLAIHLLGQEIAPMTNEAEEADGLWDKVKAHFKNPVTWKSAAYLLLKFPIGIASFVLTVTAVSLIGGLVFAPFVYQTGDISIFAWQIDTLFEALISTAIGLAIAPLAFRVLNGAAQLSGQFAGFMLGSSNQIQEKSPEDLIKMA
ncbi:MAG: sensor domain-containing protein [Chloroflexota bacterium]